MLTWEQLREMAQSGLVDIENHTAHHPYLSRETPQQVERELNDCARAIEEHLGQRSRFVSYPSGKPGVDFSDETVRVVRELGYRAAVSTELGSNPAGANLFRLKRDQSIRRDFYSFVWLITGGPDIVPALRQLVGRLVPGNGSVGRFFKPARV
jgi:peptidoglycan/xylan/chitin deacetylase (PgdA/CDA1 family)